MFRFVDENISLEEAIDKNKIAESECFLAGRKSYKSIGIQMIKHAGENRKSSEEFWWVMPIVAIATWNGMGENSAIAQIIPDGTLGSESSIVVPLDGLSDRIDGGAVRGGNLFHSFGEFNIDTGRGAFFSNPAAIENILTRVTGGNPSNIFGTLGVLGEANLFLINPSGIVFGPNARLDVGGSFFASTAEGILFRDGYEFSATNPDAPPLLTVNVPIGLQFGANPGEIEVEGPGVSFPIQQEGELFADFTQRRIEFQQGLFETPLGLQVPAGETFGLVGGNVSLAGGVVSTPAGRVELGSVGENGLVTISPRETGFTLAYDGIENFGQIELSQQALAIASGDSTSGSGNIRVRGGNVTLAEASNVVVDTLGSPPGGQIRLEVDRLSIAEESSIATNTYRDGSAGSIEIDATESVELRNYLPDGLLQVSSRGGTGDAGEVTISTRNLRLLDGASIFTIASGESRGGSIAIRATESVTLSGLVVLPSGQPVPSGISITTLGTGAAGTISIDTGRLLLEDGTRIFLISGGGEVEGTGRELTIVATESIELIGATPDGRISSGLGVFVLNRGQGGDLAISTRQLMIRDGGDISVVTTGEERGGTLTIDATESVELTGRTAVPFTTVNELESLRTTATGRLASRLEASNRSSGDAGNITIATERLILQDGARISAANSGEGRGGRLTIDATSIDIIGVAAFPDTLVLENEGQIEFSDTLTPSTTLSTETSGVGNGGEILISTEHLSIRDGGDLSVNTFGEGQGGAISINASEFVEVIGASAEGGVSSLNAITSGMGNSERITISTRQLRVRDGGDISISTFGEGQGGILEINATESVEVVGFSADNSRSNLSALALGSGDAGEISISTPQLSVREGGNVQVFTTGTGRGGLLTVNASESVELSGVSPDGFASRFFAGTRDEGDGGNIFVETGQLRVADGATISVNSSLPTPDELQAFQEAGIEISGNLGNPGSIEIAADDLRLENEGFLNATSSTGRGGNIAVRGRDIRLREGLITASGSGSDPTLEGNIDLNAETLVLLDNSRITTSSADPQGGSNIAIRPLDGESVVVLVSPNSLINAEGELIVEGEIDPDPAEVPDIETTDVTSLISQGCQDYEGSEFYITGRGGLPPNPRDILPGSSLVELDWVEDEPELAIESSQRRDRTPTQTPTQAEHPPLIEAQGWIADEAGNIILTAEPYRGTPHPLVLQHLKCQDGDRLREAASHGGTDTGTR